MPQFTTVFIFAITTILLAISSAAAFVWTERTAQALDTNTILLISVGSAFLAGIITVFYRLSFPSRRSSRF